MDGTIRLTCEFLHNPLGIQTARPRFSWYSDEPKGMQAGWRIRVAASEEDLRGGPLLWDSGPVASGRCTAIPYEGVTLESRRRYWWRLTLSLAGEDEPLESAPAWFETGILSPGEWQADWMAAPAHTYGVTDWFRRPFRLAAPPVSARLYISGIGYCEAFLNGEKIGDRLLDPGWTDYRRRVLYSVYDITPYLREGENVLGVELAEGWYGHRHESFDRFMGGQPAFQGTPRLLLEADIRLADGGRVRLLSGPAGGFSTHPGAVVENGVYDGEVYDARREQPGWACPGPVGAAWKPVEAAEPPGGVLTAQLMPPIRRLDTLTPRCLLRVADGRLVADFGRNFAGWVTMTVRAPPVRPSPSARGRPCGRTAGSTRRICAEPKAGIATFSKGRTGKPGTPVLPITASATRNSSCPPGWSCWRPRGRRWRPAWSRPAASPAAIRCWKAASPP